jgi:hypothetical protein
VIDDEGEGSGTFAAAIAVIVTEHYLVDRSGSLDVVVRVRLWYAVRRVRGVVFKSCAERSDAGKQRPIRLRAGSAANRGDRVGDGRRGRDGDEMDDDGDTSSRLLRFESIASLVRCIQNSQSQVERIDDLRAV